MLSYHRKIWQAGRNWNAQVSGTEILISVPKNFIYLFEFFISITVSGTKILNLFKRLGNLAEIWTTYGWYQSSSIKTFLQVGNFPNSKRVKFRKHFCNFSLKTGRFFLSKFSSLVPVWVAHIAFVTEYWASNLFSMHYCVDGWCC